MARPPARTVRSAPDHRPCLPPPQDSAASSTAVAACWNAKSRELISAITLRHGGITIDRRDPTAVAMVGGELQPLGTTTADDSPLDTPNRSVGVIHPGPVLRPGGLMLRWLAGFAVVSVAVGAPCDPSSSAMSYRLGFRWSVAVPLVSSTVSGCPSGPNRADGPGPGQEG